ncbi:MAG TPA: gamma-glutamyltransferase [Solirubrobacteraceae bacterium]|nr:gamma-glutamyltransferase [Solirubrobacteraceae bacterium]
MNTGAGGVVAAGHPLTAHAGAQALRGGGNAVDAAIAALLASFATEPLLTGLGAGGYMLVAGPGVEPTLLDFFAESPSRRDEGAAALRSVDVSFGSAVQNFHGGAASCAVYGMPAGVCAAAQRWARLPLTALAAEAELLARDGVELNAPQAYVAEILTGLLAETPECAAIWAPEGRVLREGERIVCPGLADAIALLAREGAEPFYRGHVAAAVTEWVWERGGFLTAADLAGYRAIERAPARVGYRGRELLTNPPPAAGGTLLAYSLGLLDRAPPPPTLEAIVDAMRAAQEARTDEFVAGLAAPGFLEEFMQAHLGSTTHISVLDGDGLACSVTSTNGEGSGVVVPGTGIHLNNMLGEQDLNPLGFHRHEPGVRLPSMMAPSVVLRDGAVELVLGSAGSNRIRSALLQVIVGVADRGLDAHAALDAPRVHFEDDVLYAEPGIDTAAIGVRTVHFSAPNLFFGGVQAVLSRDGRIEGAGDPRRGGAAEAA